MPTAAAGQRLRCLRSPVAFSAEVAVVAAGHAHYARLVNLSGSGCLLQTDRLHRAGEALRLRFSVPSSMEVEVEAVVVRVEAGRIGVAFTRIDERVTETIARLVVAQRHCRAS